MQVDIALVQILRDLDQEDNHLRIYSTIDIWMDQIFEMKIDMIITVYQIEYHSMEYIGCFVIYDKLNFIENKAWIYFVISRFLMRNKDLHYCKISLIAHRIVIQSNCNWRRHVMVKTEWAMLYRIALDQLSDIRKLKVALTMEWLLRWRDRWDSKIYSKFF